MSTMTKAGRYEIVGELGRGAMGVVYRANDPVIGRSVAVKTIRLTEEGTGLSRPELLSRFQIEARAAGLLTHPNIVVVYDAGEEDGLYYITMELVEGKSLQALLDGGHAFPVPRILRILEQTCSALGFAHERNIVHRDIKPANLMLSADDTLKVTDFGTAKILQFGTVQQTTHVMGTPSYMSPEQVKGRPIDGRTDIFSLGVVMYEMLTNEKPFPGQSITTVIYKIVNEEPIPPRQLNPSLHPGLNEIVMRALAKEPEERYQSCRELLEDLRNYRSINVQDRANPDATLVSPRSLPGQPFSTPTSTIRSPYFEDAATAATARSLQNRALTPSQTPAVRRTGALPPLQEPEPEKKSSTLTTVLAAIFLLGVIAYGGTLLRPEFQAARERNKLSHVEAAPVPQAVTPPPSETPVATTDNAAATPASVPAVKPSKAAASDAEPPAAPPPAPKKVEMPVSSAAADYKRQIEDAIAEKDLTGRVKVSAAAGTVMLNGKLRPSEHASLLKFMRNAPTDVRIVDDIQYDDSPVASTEPSDNGTHPVPAAGKSAIHIVTNVIGATATVYGPAGHKLSDCQTPCSFNNLAPNHYSLQIQKDGYLAVQTAVETKSGQALDQRIQMEALAKGLYVSSRPAGADIFINGAKQSGQTPVTLPLAGGQYDLVLRMPGYEAYSTRIQVKDNVQTTLDVELKQKQELSRVAWAQVNSTPQGAEIFIDGNDTGQVSPARVQVPTGTHIIALRLKGYDTKRHGIEVSDGGTVSVTETLHAK
jgi:eukaryotic-like serine/threonine-protein kinase